MPVGEAQSVLSVHSTQVLVEPLQAGVAPLHWVSFCVVQTTHAPDVAHAGLVGSFAAQAVSVVQAWHWCVDRLQSGALADPQSLSDRQAAHYFGEAVELQSGVALGHAADEVSSQISTKMVVVWLPGSDCWPSVG